MIDWSKYQGSMMRRPNVLKMPQNRFGFDEEGKKEFNEIYQWCLQKEKEGFLDPYVRTPSGGISISLDNFRGPGWYCDVSSTSIELVTVGEDYKHYRFVVGYKKDKSDNIGGRRAFQVYKKTLLKHGVDIEDYAIENGEEVKKQIPSPIIRCECHIGTTYKGAHHIDLNTSYQSGIGYSFPKFQPAIGEIYDKRTGNDKVYKQVLNCTQGFMQSKYVNYRFAHISKAGYDYTNRVLMELSNKLEDSGRIILGYNTDGIWYVGDLYHDENEGTGLGQWKHDHKNCIIRYKSDGCYEFIEDGKYTPVFRGTSSYERIVPREEWQWGDIFKGNDVKYKFVKGVGLVSYDIE